MQHVQIHLLIEHDYPLGSGKSCPVKALSSFRKAIDSYNKHEQYQKKREKRDFDYSIKRLSIEWGKLMQTVLIDYKYGEWTVTEQGASQNITIITAFDTILEAINYCSIHNFGHYYSRMANKKLKSDSRKENVCSM